MTSAGLFQNLNLGRWSRVREKCLPSCVHGVRSWYEIKIKALWSLCFVMCFCSNIQEMRARHKDAFLKKHNLKLGFMSAFVKASAFALQEQPVVNAGEFVVAGPQEVLGDVCRNTDCSHTHRKLGANRPRLFHTCENMSVFPQRLLGSPS